MVNADEEAIEIPIEFRPKDLRKLKEVREDVDRIEKKTKKIRDKTSAQAVPTLEAEQRGGIFGGATETKGSIFKDKTTAAPIQRKNVLFEKINNLEKAQKKTDALIGGFQKGAAFVPFGAGGGPLGALKGLAFKMVPFIGIALVAKGVIQGILTELLRPGGFLDRRLKIFVGKQLLVLTKRDEAAQLSRGFRTLIVTSTPGLRGPTSQLFNTQQAIKSGIPLLAENQEALSKGVLP